MCLLNFSVKTSVVLTALLALPVVAQEDYQVEDILPEQTPTIAESKRITKATDVVKPSQEPASSPDKTSMVSEADKETVDEKEGEAEAPSPVTNAEIVENHLMTAANSVATIETPVVENSPNLIEEPNSLEGNLDPIEATIVTEVPTEEIASSPVTQEKPSESADILIEDEPVLNAEVETTEETQEAPEVIPETKEEPVMYEADDLAQTTPVPPHSLTSTRGANCPADFYTMPVYPSAKFCQLFDETLPASMSYFAISDQMSAKNFYIDQLGQAENEQMLSGRIVLQYGNGQKVVVISKDGQGSQIDILVKTAG